MTGKERIQAIFNREPIDRSGFWLGNPADDTKLIYARALGLKPGPDVEIQLHEAVGSDFYWASPELDPKAYQHPEGRPMFDIFGGKARISLAQPGIFANCESLEEIEAFEWPKPDYLHFEESFRLVEAAQSKGMAVFGGMWMPFFHIVADFFGMENYFMKMYTHPEIVHAVSNKVLDFYLAANQRCLDLMGDQLDAQFFGNDLGGQSDLLISPELLQEFVYPGIKRIIDQAKSYNLKVVLHSCGSVSALIPDLIKLGIDGLHPIQAKARGMDANNLASQFGDQLIFIGGIDTQELLPFGSAEAVKSETLRIKNIFGNNLIVSPSHEALLSNVPLENVWAMREAVNP